MVRDGRGVSIPLTLLVGLVATALSYLALRIWTGEGGVLPAPSWGALIVLLFMATGVLFAGLPVRRFLRGQARKPLNPLRAMRTLVLAQAAALTGALITVTLTRTTRPAPPTTTDRAARHPGAGALFVDVADDEEHRAEDRDHVGNEVARQHLGEH